MRLPILALVLLGCSGGPTQITVPGRPTGSAIVALTGALGSDRAIGVEFPGQVSFETLLEDDRFVLYAAYHPCSLAWLGATDGRVDIGGTGSLPPGAEIDVARFGDGVLSAFERVAYSESIAAAVHLSLPPPGARCVHFEPRPVTLPDSGLLTAATLAVPIRGEEILIAYNTAIHPQRVTPQGGQAIDTLPIGPYLAGHLAAPDDIWLVHADGSVLRGNLEDGFLPMPSLTQAATIAPSNEGRMVSADAGHPFELYVYSQTDAIERFDGDRWTIVARTGLEISRGNGVDLVWAAPGELYASPGASDRILHWVDGAAEIETPLPGDKVRSLERIADGRILAGLESGGVVERVDRTTWRSLGDSRMSQDIRALTPLDNGFIAGGGFGGLSTQLHPEESSYCPPDQPLPGEFATLLPIETGMFVVPRRKGPNELIAFYWRRASQRTLVPCHP